MSIATGDGNTDWRAIGQDLWKAAELPSTDWPSQPMAEHYLHMLDLQLRVERARAREAQLSAARVRHRAARRVRRLSAV